MTDGEADGEGHEKDVDEDPGEYLDRQFSRDGVLSVFIGLSAGKIVETLILLVASTLVAQLIAWTVVFPGAIALAWYWPILERRYAEYLPWMTPETPKP